MAIGLALRRLLDPQGLDGGGLLAYEEAQPLEAGLMIVRWMDDASRIARPRVWRERGEHTVSYDGFDTASASNLGGGDDGKVAAPTQSSTQKTASHLIRLGRTACGVDHVLR
eukprot:scaffold93372_cov30-Phaeocystis_antarctica.AAC.1